MGDSDGVVMPWMLSILCGRALDDLMRDERSRRLELVVDAQTPLSCCLVMIRGRGTTMTMQSVLRGFVRDWFISGPVGGLLSSMKMIWRSLGIDRQVGQWQRGHKDDAKETWNG